MVNCNTKNTCRKSARVNNTADYMRIGIDFNKKLFYETVM